MSREEDVYVATKMFGWQLFPYILPGVPDWEHRYCPPGEVHISTVKEVPAYTSEPAADFSVLERCRETWDSSKLCDLRDEFNKIHERRAWDTQKAGNHDTVWGVTQYLPGDWSRAALAVLKAKESTHA